eukprot:gb/GEZJ01005307.1/.p2 GENE.gb/GEZJ01005307.1/~~gb/GEZJ01005307.1/.p2  ORF type:complete len:145 (+),score=18.34 gb/GEZJ01005307.1/:960-1394(+)
MDDTGLHNIIHYSSYKSRRLVRSTMGAELYAFCDAFDNAYLLKRELQSMLNENVPLNMLTDSDSVFKSIMKGTKSTEKRLMLDIMAARDAYHNMEISKIGWILDTDNPADGLTKNKPCSRLEQLLDTGYCPIPVKQWILRGVDV